MVCCNQTTASFTILYQTYVAWCDLKIYLKVILVGFPVSSLAVVKGDFFHLYLLSLLEKKYVSLIQQRGLIRYMPGYLYDWFLVRNR
jgi:hypothetical protein